MKKLLIITFLMFSQLSSAFTRETIIISSSTLLGAGIGAAYYFRNKPADKPIDKAHLVGAILLGSSCGILGGGILARIVEIISEKKPEHSSYIQVFEDRIRKEWATRDGAIQEKAATTKKLLKEQQAKNRAQNQRDLQIAAFNLRTSITEKDSTKQAAAQEELKHIPGPAELLHAHEEALNNIDKITEDDLLKNNQAFSEKMAMLDPNLSQEELEIRCAEIDQKYDLT